jgi:glutamine---fructose-6-phosphate transaminase (isomerizing)
MTLASEIAEQPDRLSDLLSGQRKEAEKIAANIRRAGIRYVFLAARGTSDNAGRYANYLWGAVNRMPVALAAPSLFTLYHRPPKLAGALVVGISQSGQSPDIVSVLKEGKRQGCLTLAITNTPDSPLARIADLVLDVQAGAEHTVAATKTYTSELMTIAMLSAAMAGDDRLWKDLRRIPRWAGLVLGNDERVADACLRYREMQRCVVLGRGYNYATAYEWALKLKELSYVEAEAYSSADFLHGPIALMDPGFPVLAVAAKGRVFKSMRDVLSTLRSKHKADMTIISNSAEALELARSPIPLPAGAPEWLTPIIAIIPGQLFALHLTVARGYDPDEPRTIHKVTETR